ncbi:MAG TPA: hypothetical protein VK856_11675 [Anaerolineaceae bacterium]|nr:hypothetical protein [Anaerolineaceae bacterium]
MKKKLILLTLVIIGVLILSACKAKNQAIEENNLGNTPDVAYPAPINPATPEIGYPVEATETPIQNDYPAPIMTEEPILVGDLQLDLLSEFSLDEPGGFKWCPDQSCFSVIGFDYFSVLSYPNFETMYFFTSEEYEFLLDISPDGRTFAITNNNEDLILRNWETNSEFSIPTNTSFMGAEFSPDGTKILITSNEQWSASIFDVTTGELLTTLTGFETAAPVYNVRFKQSNDYVIWIARATAQVSEISSNQLYPGIYHQDFILDYDLNSEGTLLATSAAEAVNDEFLPTVFFYDFKTGELLEKFNTQKAIYSMVFSPDNSELAISLGSSISIYDLEIQTIASQFISEEEAISQIAYSPDGMILVSVGEGLHIKFYSLN